MTRIGLLLSAALWLLGAERAFATEQVKLHVSGASSPNALVYRFANDNGFYKAEGLEVLPIMAGMLPGIQGLIAGSFDFSQILGQGAGAILRGVPLKIVMVFDTRPLWWLFGGKNIKNLQMLKAGKKATTQVAISSFGAALDQVTREVLPKHGVVPDRDVVLRAVGNAPDRLAAVINGSVDAAVVDHMGRIVAKKQQLNELLFYGDQMEFVSGGVVATEKTLSERPELVRRFLRGTLKGFLWWKFHEKEVVSKLAEIWRISETEAVEIYRSSLMAFSADGTIPRGLQERMIAFQKKALRVEREIAPESVYDFSVLGGLKVEFKNTRF
ncbi:MAG: ABC transporter substrate-binding protein [Deltaproteobacteria bacterium]|nr:ABC transporter substrate-binding protein [Deltaproteobacteria bacterium]